MIKRITTVAVFLLALVVVASGCGLLRQPEEASAPIEAMPLEVEAEAAAIEAPATAAPVAEEAPVEALAAAAAAGGLPVFTISPADSQVRFELDEELRGQHQTVVGATDQLAGELAVDFEDLASTQVGTIQINARTLRTDNSFRNRAIQNAILNTGAFEFITFEPTAVEGLPESVAIGETVSFAIACNLTIRDVTQAETFTVEATPLSETQLAGTATAVIAREDYGLRIPDVPNVANVEEEVELTIDFLANAS